MVFIAELEWHTQWLGSSLISTWWTFLLLNYFFELDRFAQDYAFLGAEPFLIALIPIF